ncbi:MAG: ABC transporter substrate-binding protein, partial [Chthoniobacterales bacterium]
ADAKGLIFDVLAVNPSSYAQHKAEWAKVAGIYYKAVDYLADPKTREDAVKIMAAKVGADAADYARNVPGTHFLTLAEARAAFKKGDGLMSVYGSMEIGNKFNLDNGVYKESQKPASYLTPAVVNGL